MMINTNYRIDALSVLLDPGCLSERYAPLIPYKERLITGLKALGCRTKHDAELLPDDVLLGLGLPDAGVVRLFRRFLTIYDVSPQKLREIDKVTADPAERAAFRELYCLPGVKQIRASLYCRAGYETLQSVADASVEEILTRTAQVIAEDSLSCIVPLPKEVRTHIAVAKAFTES
ncbi:MAG: hypothetical protein MJ192_10730 [Clostridia bacterium]|nr:hypothetical protein [Clostridia bacterium]